MAGISVKHTHQQHLDPVPFVQATGVAVEPQYFNLATGKVFGVSNAPELNAKIQARLTSIETAIRNLVERGVEPFKKNLEKELKWIAETNTVEQVGQEVSDEITDTSLSALQSLLSKAEKRVETIKRQIEQKEIELGIYTGKLFVAHIDEFIAKSSSTLKPNSIKNYKGLKQAVEEFNPSLNITDVSIKTLEQFRDFLLTEKKLRTKSKSGEYEKGLRNSSTREFIQKFKIVYYAFSDKFNYDVTKIKKWKHNVKKLQNDNVVYLTPDELDAVVAAECITDRERLHRDFYVFMSQTGLRFVDARLVTAGHVKDGALRIIQQKTTKKVTIPLTQLAISILERYNYNFGDVKYTAQVRYYMNQLLKRNNLLSYPMSRTHYKQNVGSEEVKIKRELISAHTARKTFINISLIKGVKITSIKNIVGHSELKMIMDVYGDGTVDNAEMAKAFEMPKSTGEVASKIKVVA